MGVVQRRHRLRLDAILAPSAQRQHERHRLPPRARFRFRPPVVNVADSANVYACTGEVRLAPESTWQGVAPEELRKRPITLLSRTALHGETDFFTFMPSGLNWRRWSIPERWWDYGTWLRKTYEIAMPTAQEATALTWAVFWLPFVTGIGFLIGGVLIAIGA